jgi:ABC-type transporter Mla MlaB component
MIEKKEGKNENEFNISGILDFNNVSLILKQACQIIDNASQEIIFNFSELRQSNSAGLSLLTSLLRHAEQVKKNIQFLHLPGKLWEAAKISNLDEVLPCA